MEKRPGDNSSSDAIIDTDNTSGSRSHRNRKSEKNSNCRFSERIPQLLSKDDPVRRLHRPEWIYSVAQRFTGLADEIFRSSENQT